MNVKSQRDFLLGELKRHARNIGRFNLAGYIGTTHVVYNVSVPKRRQIVTDWVKKHKDIDKNDLIKLADLLFRGTSHEEKSLASMLLGRYPKHLTTLEATRFDRWLVRLTGWAEVDLFCNIVDLWLRADVNKRLNDLNHFNKSKQIEKRRASLVVLCSSVRLDDSKRLADLSFKFIDALKHEKHVMITKAISWLLRALIKYHKEEVARYLKINSTTLPKIAVREVMRKLETGKK